ncbi:uncharacterized protein LTR77_008712 [Saxophila tyrrhenica]|uniref:Uncharacterized protein n=1 Tax=Saxophila tyrrhenica TaxID=1690608 RepID=A0AAV9P0P7_9PEZI|nr:hypothetical protein LTR77_008712 [Saxophila tyrrhenica]
MPTQSNPRTWTLRFKSHRTTILLHIDPIQTFPSVKRDLLEALTQTNPSGTFNGHQIPQNSEAIVLGKPVDINDLTRGWETIQTSGSGDSESSGKGKGKAGSATPAKASGKNQVQDCPQGAGLRDGGIVAFKFRGQDESERADRTQGEDEDEIVVAKEDQINKEGEQWDVVVPTLEETYGDQVAEMMEDEDEGIEADAPNGSNAG